jgi:hypothetical protein
LYYNHKDINKHDDHRFYRDSFRVSRIRRYVNDNEQVFQKNELNRKQRNIKRIKMSISMTRLFVKKALKIISRDYIRSRLKISQCLLKSQHFVTWEYFYTLQLHITHLSTINRREQIKQLKLSWDTVMRRMQSHEMIRERRFQINITADKE